MTTPHRHAKWLHALADGKALEACQAGFRDEP